MKNECGTQHVAASVAVQLQQLKEIMSWGNPHQGIDSAHFAVSDVTWFNSSVKVRLADGKTFVATFADVTELVNEPPF